MSIYLGGSRTSASRLVRIYSCSEQPVKYCRLGVGVALPTADPGPFPSRRRMPQTRMGSTAPLPQDLYDFLHSDTHSGRRRPGSPTVMDGAHATAADGTFFLPARNGTQDRTRHTMRFHNGYRRSSSRRRRAGSRRPCSTTAASR
ncbi:hypothetical protein Taro_056540 [Colocasia esculenta]|uniref:Uncharacterized protein n=1 Tax=Colocasia esculenta TaxID=4460 RepID=A0A843XW27_COLES|nr:hypothetical protein [Colocasia esculenta]